MHRETYDEIDNYVLVAKFMAEQGLIQEGQRDNIHDDPIVALNMFIDDPNSVRFDERVKARRATINGVDISNRAKNAQLAKTIVEYRATVTAEAIRKAVSAKGKPTK